MKKVILGVAAFALIFSSCAKNELLDSMPSEPNDGMIRFTGLSTIQTKAATGNPINSTSDLRALAGGFNVVGYGVAGSALENDRYLDANVTWNTTTLTWEYTPSLYWPNLNMNFFAYAPTATGTAANILSKDGIVVTDFTVGANNAQLDLVVASSLNRSKEQRTPLTFKHALTQVIFKAMKITGSNLDIVISGVEIANINSVGTFTSTATPAADFPQNYWSALNNPVTYNASPSAAFTVAAEGVIGSTTAATAIKQAADNNALVMIPQNFTAWDPSNATTTAGVTYIKLTAKISQQITIGGVPTTVYLCGSAAADGEIFIPVSSQGLDTNDKKSAPLGQWVPGRRINYIITFGDTNSGSGGGGFDEDGDPVLVPIKFTAELEEWWDQDVPLLTATFTGNIADINGYTTQLANDIKSPTAPKRYTAKITSNGTLAANTALTLTPLVETTGNPIGSGFRILPGTTVTYDFAGLIFNGKEISFTAPTGWTSTTASPLTAAGEILLIRDAWTIAEIKGSVERKATATTYAASTPANSDDLKAWVPAGLAKGETFTVQFTGTTLAPQVNASWTWDAANNRAIYTQL